MQKKCPASSLAGFVFLRSSSAFENSSSPHPRNDLIPQIANILQCRLRICGILTVARAGCGCCHIFFKQRFRRFFFWISVGGHGFVWLGFLVGAMPVRALRCLVRLIAPAQPIAHEEYPLHLVKSSGDAFHVKNNNPDASHASGLPYHHISTLYPFYSSSGQSATASSSAESANDTVGAL